MTVELLAELEIWKNRALKAEAALNNARSEIDEVREFVYRNGIPVSHYDGYDMALKIIDRYMKGVTD